MIVVLPLLIALIGLLMYVLSAHPEIKEIGRIMFFCGLFVIMLGAKDVVALFR